VNSILKKGFFPIILMVVLFLGLFIVGLMIPDNVLKKTMYDAGPFGPLLLIFLFWLANFFAPLSGSPFLFAGYYLYGRQVVLYATIAAIIASATNFLVAKRWGRPLVVRLAGEEALLKVDKLANNYGLPTLLISRVFFKEIHDVVSYAFGLTALKFWQYFIVSTFGMIPPTILWYYLSGKLHNAVSFTLFSWVMVYVPIGVYLLYKKISNK
jgi:uncharacterized membrane protein YdjX (TVP38/TMEM64 family)